MTITPIATVLQSTPGTILPGVKGIIKTVSERYVGTTPSSPGNPGRAWSLQTIIIQDDTGEMAVQVANHEAVEQEKAGQPIYLLSKESATGRLTGVKVDVEDNNKILRVSTSGEVAWAEPEIAGGGTVARQTTATEAPTPRPVAVAPPAPISTGASAVARPTVPPQARVPVPDAQKSDVSGDRAGWNPVLETIDAYEQLYSFCLQRVLKGSVMDTAKNGYGMNPAHICAATDAVFRAVLATRPSLPLENVI